jgi:hypothetical protein
MDADGTVRIGAPTLTASFVLALAHSPKVLPEPEADYQEQDGTERPAQPSTRPCVQASRTTYVCPLYLDTMEQDGELDRILKERGLAA